MNAPIFGVAAIGAPAAAGVMLLAAFALTGCDQVVQWKRPELAACQRFVRSRMKLPTSFHRQYYNITDIPIDKAVLGDAIGRTADKAAMARAPWPVIRDVFIQYYGDNSFGEPVFAATNCNFAMSDGTGGVYARDPEASVDEAVAENEARTLDVSLGREDVVAADCCVAKDFDPKRLVGIKRVPRGEKPKGKTT